MDFSSFKREGKSKKGTVHFWMMFSEKQACCLNCHGEMVDTPHGVFITRGFQGVFFWGHLHVLQEDLYFNFIFP